MLAYAEYPASIALVSAELLVTLTIAPPSASSGSSRWVRKNGPFGIARTPGRDVHVHVGADGDAEVGRYLAFENVRRSAIT